MRGAFLDIVALAGFTSFIYGVYLIHAPSAFIVGGSLVTVAAVFAARSRS